MTIGIRRQGSSWHIHWEGSDQELGPTTRAVVHRFTRSAKARNELAIIYGIPEAYRFARLPLPITIAVLQHGAQVYEQNCASCNGTRERGDGPLAADFEPRPADLAWLAYSSMTGDEYIYWTISEGGVP